jgi:hypothetical protein
MTLTSIGQWIGGATRQKGELTRQYEGLNGELKQQARMAVIATKVINEHLPTLKNLKDR